MDTKELIESCTRMLNQRQQTENGGNMAKSPVIILFLGNIAYSQIQHVKNALDANLKNGSFLQYLHLYFEGDECRAENAVLNVQYNNVEDAIQEAWLTMFGTDASVFRSKQDVYIECILNSYEARAEKYYEEYRRLHGRSQYNLIKSLYLMIDQQTRAGEEQAQRLIDKICAEYKSSADSAGIYLLSNLLYDGSILLEDRIWQNYRLVADLILLGNTVGSLAITEEGRTYSYSGLIHDGVMTAAYTYVGKPLEHITKVSLYYLMKKLYEREESSVYKPESRGELQESFRKKLAGKTGIELIEEIFRRQIKRKLPAAQDAQWLPWRNRKDYKRVSGKNVDWHQVNEMTCGVLDGYYRLQYEEVLSKETGNHTFAEDCWTRMRKLIQEKFSFFEILQDLGDGDWRQIVRDVLGIFPTAVLTMVGMPGEMAELRLLQTFRQWACVMLEDEFQRIYDSFNCLKEGYLNVLEEMRKATISFDGKNEYVDRYYENEVEQFLLSEQHLLKEPLFRTDCTLDEILNRVKELFGQLIEQRDIYREPFEKEEALRLGNMSEQERSKSIKNRLSTDVGSQGRLHLNNGYREQRTGTFCLVNFASVYMEELKEDEQRGNFAIFELNRRDCLEMVELYRLEQLDRIKLKG